MLDTYKKIRDLLDARERRNAILLFGMMLVMALFETIGVASVMPFVSVVANPDSLETNAYLSAIYESLGFSGKNAFLVFLGAGVFVLVVGSLTFKALTHWAIARYTHMRNFTLSSRLLRAYLGRPYTFFLNRHSADLGKSVLAEVQQVVKSVLMAGLQLVASSIVAICLIVLVVAVDPVVALTAVVFLGGAYASIYFLLRHYISHIGARRVRANQARFQVAQEALGGIKDVKVLGLEDGYIRSFRRPATRFAQVQAHNQMIGELPQFALQALVFGGMLLLLIGLLITREGDLGRVLPLIVLYAFAGSRLMPALQAMYKSMTLLRFGKPALDDLHRDLVDANQAGASPSTGVVGKPLERLRLRERIELEHVYYTYPDAGNPALVDLSLSISARTTVGFVGGTGAGKTTVVDVILGLLEPQKGRLLVDGVSVTGESLRAWQRNIGYVSQSIFLTDDTVAANIAFGVPEDMLDLEAVERAARIAGLHNYVANNMADGYDSLVGERGVRLSGGQRQRIGIARALYHDPAVLILDEATSALDNVTEKEVMKAIHNLGHRKTIILITHRLSTVVDCDEIFMLQQGQLVAQGRYETLLQDSQPFQAMAGTVQQIR